MAKQIPVSVSSNAHAFLLKWWAKWSGRSTSNLASYLLEKAIEQALRDGDVPAMAVEAMERGLQNTREYYQDEFLEEVEATDQGANGPTF